MSGTLLLLPTVSIGKSTSQTTVGEGTGHHTNE